MHHLVLAAVIFVSGAHSASAQSAEPSCQNPNSKLQIELCRQFGAVTALTDSTFAAQNGGQSDGAGQGATRAQAAGASPCTGLSSPLAIKFCEKANKAATQMQQGLTKAACEAPKSAEQVELCRQLIDQGSRALGTAASPTEAASAQSAETTTAPPPARVQPAAQSGATSGATGKCGGSTPKETALRGFRIGMSRDEAYAAAQCAMGPWELIVEENESKGEKYLASFGYRDGPPGATSVNSCIARRKIDDAEDEKRNPYLLAERRKYDPDYFKRNQPERVCSKGLNTFGGRYIALYFKDNALRKVEFQAKYLYEDLGYALSSANVGLEAFADSLGRTLGVKLVKKEVKGVDSKTGVGQCNFGPCVSDPQISSYTDTTWSANYLPCNCQVIVSGDRFAGDRLILEQMTRSDAINF